MAAASASFLLNALGRAMSAARVAYASTLDTPQFWTVESRTMKNASAGNGVFGCWTSGCIAALTSLILVSAAGAEPPATGIAVRTAVVDGLTLQYLEAGRGPAVVLLHGYAETSRMWRPLMPQLAERFTVIAPDLPGIGDSDIPENGLDMKSAAIRIHELAKSLGVAKALVVGHDIGWMV